MYRLVKQRQREEERRALARGYARQANRLASAALPAGPSKQVRRLQRVYYCVTALYWFATVLPMAVSVLFAQARGLSLSQIGLYIGLYSLTIVFLEVPTGGLADALGRKRVTLLAYGLAILAKVLFLVAFSFPAFLGYAVLWGAARALGSGALEAWFIDALHDLEPSLDVQPPLALAGTFELLALALGTLAGGLLPQLFAYLPEEGTAVLTPLSTTVVASILMNFVALLAVALLIEEKRPPAQTLKGSLYTSFQELPLILRDAYRLTRHNPALLLLLGTELAGGFALTGIETLWQPFFANRLGDGVQNTILFGLLLAGSFGAGMLGNLAATPLSRLFRKRYALVAALFQLLQGVMLVALAWQVSAVTAALFLWLTYLTRGTLNSPHAALFNAEVPPHRRSVMLSVQSLVGYFGAFLGSAVLGSLAEAVSISAAWTLAGCFVAVTVGFYLLLDRHLRNNKRGNCTGGGHAEAAYDSADIREAAATKGSTPHTKHHSRRSKKQDPALPGRASYPARRWVVERTLSWLTKRRSIRTGCSKKVASWTASLPALTSSSIGRPPARFKSAAATRCTRLDLS